MTGTPDQISQALEFLTVLYGDRPEGTCFVLWELARKKSTCWSDLEKAATWAAGRKDIYTHVGLTSKTIHPDNRVKAAEVEALPALWADVDYAHPLHKKNGLPSSRGAAMLLIESLPLAPTIVVHTGHGLQAWWRFNEPWNTATPDLHQYAERMARAWNATLQAKAKALGCALDVVSDLSRLMRLPGTVNAKDPAVPVPVEVEQIDRARLYSGDDAEAALIEGAWALVMAEERPIRQNGDAIGEDGDLVLNAAAEPPYQKVLALMANEERFADALARKRRSRTDTRTASEFNASAAYHAAEAGWDRQEITNLIIANRREYGDDLKLRQKYYADLVKLAMGTREEVLERDAINSAVLAALELRTNPTDQPDRSTLLGKLSDAIGVPITRITVSSGASAIYSIESPFGAGVIGPIGHISSNTKWRDSVAGITQKFPRRLKNDRWDRIAELILTVAERDDVGAEADTVDNCETLVSLYLGTHPVVDYAKLDPDALSRLPVLQTPYAEHGQTFLFGNHFRVWLVEHQAKMTTNGEFGMMLKAWGAMPSKRKFRVSGRWTTRGIWQIPASTEPRALDTRYDEYVVGTI